MKEWKWGGETIEEMEAQLIGEAYEACDRNIQKTAKLIGMSRANLYRKLKSHGIYPRKEKPERMVLTRSKKGGADDFRSE